MKNLILILFVFVAGQISLQAQTIYVVKTSDTQESFSLENIQKLSFSEGNLNIQKFDNSTNIYALNELRYLNFEDLISGFEDTSLPFTETQFVSYPNPVSDILNIDLSGFENKSGTLSVLTLEGKVIYMQKTMGDNLVKIDLRDLAKGIYLCRYSTEKEIKTVKIIKQ